MDLRGSGGGGRIPRHHHHDWVILIVPQRYFVDGGGGAADSGWLFDERYDRDVRPHSREFENRAAGETGDDRELERESDAEPDGADQRFDAVDGAVSVVVRR